MSEFETKALESALHHLDQIEKFVQDLEKGLKSDKKSTRNISIATVFALCEFFQDHLPHIAIRNLRRFSED